MTPRLKLTVTLVLLVLLGGIGAADYYVSRGEYTAAVTENDADIPLPPGAVAKYAGPDVGEVISENEGLEHDDSDDLSLIAQVVTDSSLVQSFAVLEEGDRTGSVTWVASPDVKTYFLALKEALLDAFSPALADLRDETLQEQGKPVRNVLSFIDPALSEEKIVFVRVRERLYEFHVAEGGEAAMNRLIEQLTGK